MLYNFEVTDTLIYALTDSTWVNSVSKVLSEHRKSNYYNKLICLIKFNKGDFVKEFNSVKFGKIFQSKSNPYLILVNNKVLDMNKRAFIGVIENKYEYALSDFTEEQYYSKDNKFIGLQHKINLNLYYNEVTE